MILKVQSVSDLDYLTSLFSFSTWHFDRWMKRGRISLFAALFWFVSHSKISRPNPEWLSWALLCPCASCSLPAISPNQAQRGRGRRAGVGALERGSRWKEIQTTALLWAFTEDLLSPAVPRTFAMEVGDMEGKHGIHTASAVKCVEAKGKQINNRVRPAKVKVLAPEANSPKGGRKKRPPHWLKHHQEAELRARLSLSLPFPNAWHLYNKYL